MIILLIILMLIILLLLSKKDTKLYVPVVPLSARVIQNLSKLLSRGFERLVYCNEYKTKRRVKLQKMNIDIF